MIRSFLVLFLSIHVYAAEPSAQDQFWKSLQALCGKTLQGEIEIDRYDRKLEGKPSMHVRICEDDRIEIPFAVGEDRSRTWILTRTNTGLRLKHEHRHKDGTLDEVTDYGGDTKSAGEAGRQSFVVDEYTKKLVANTDKNLWVFEIKDGYVAYELYKGEAEPNFRVAFKIQP